MRGAGLPLLELLPHLFALLSDCTVDQSVPPRRVLTEADVVMTI